MNLHQIYKAAKPQFDLVDRENRPFYKIKTTGRFERYTGFFLLVFIGIANSYSIPPDEIIEYLEIGQPEYDLKTKMFLEHFEIIITRKQEGTLLTYHDRTHRLYLKTKLTLNAINTQFRGETLHSTLII